jgi:acyl-CoA thioesterase-1
LSTLIRFVQLVMIFALVSAASAADATPQARQDPARPAIVVLGDSLSAGYGIKIQQGWVNLLAQRLASEGYGYRVVNASVSGETTQGGLARLPRALEMHKPAIVIVELGGNDGLRGLPLAASRTNLDRIVELSRAAGARVLLVGMVIPPNYGPRYGQEFRDMFAALAAQHQLAFVPFLLDKVALKTEWMQADGIHANAAGQPQMLENVWPKLKRLLVAPGKPAS